MKLGNKFFLFLILFFYYLSAVAEEKITTTPLINVDQIKPSFEELLDENENITSNQDLKEKKINRLLNHLRQF